MTLDELIAVLESCAGFYDSLGADGDPLPVLDHGLQCAALLAASAPDDEELQVAGLVHDIGHRIAPGASEAHGVIAADAVRGLLGPRVAALVELHVPAKRHLVATDPSYRTALSHGSAVSLERQGGGMSAEEIARFAAGPFCADAIRLRRCDEAAKDPAMITDGLARWQPVLARVAGA
jgi:predicted HD phosphohydrolase